MVRHRKSSLGGTAAKKAVTVAAMLASVDERGIAFEIASDRREVAHSSGQAFPETGFSKPRTYRIPAQGRDRTPHQTARDFGHEDVFHFLTNHSPEDVKLSQACQLGDLGSPVDPFHSASVPGRRVSKSSTPTHSGVIAMRTICGLLPRICSTHTLPCSHPKYRSAA